MSGNCTSRKIHAKQFSCEPAQFFQSVGTTRKDIWKETETMVASTSGGASPFSKDELELDQHINRLCYFYVAKAFLEMGCWPRRENIAENELNFTGHQSENLSETFGVVPGLSRAFSYYATYLSDNTDEIVNEAQVNAEIGNILDTKVVREYGAIRILHACGSNLAGILQGHVSAHRILFDDNRFAERYYKLSRFGKCLEFLVQLFKQLISKAKRQNVKHVRILEVGAGTGAFPNQIVNFLNEIGIQFEYHFTDVSPTLVSKGNHICSKTKNVSFLFKKLDIEQDPLTQGFPPDYFDVVVAYDVLHATRNLSKVLRHVNMLMRSGGSLLVGETEKPIRELDICFGVLKGYWLFEDTHIRRDHCTVGADTWLQLLTANGFAGEPCKIISCEGQKSAISAIKTDSRIMIEEDRKWVIFAFSRAINVVAELTRCMEVHTGRHIKCVHVPDGGGGALSKENWLANITGDIGQSKYDCLEGILFCLSNNLAAHEESRLLKPLLQQISQHLVERKVEKLPKILFVNQELQLNSSTRNQEFLINLIQGVRTVFPPQIQTKFIQFQQQELSSTCLVDQLMTELWLNENKDSYNYVVYNSDGIRYLNKAGNGNSMLPCSANNKSKDSVDSKFCTDYKTLDNANDKKQLLRELLLEKLSEILGCSEEEICDDMEFSDMGVDSLMTAEFEDKIYIDIAGLLVDDDCCGDVVATEEKQRGITVNKNDTVSQLVELLLSALKK